MLAAVLVVFSSLVATVRFRHDFLRDLKERILFLFNGVVAGHWCDESIVLCNITFADVLFAARFTGELLPELARVYFSCAYDCTENYDEFVQVLRAQVSDRLCDDFLRRWHIYQLYVESVLHAWQRSTLVQTHRLVDKRFSHDFLYFSEQMLQHLVELRRVVVKHGAEHREAVDQFKQAAARQALGQTEVGCDRRESGREHLLDDDVVVEAAVLGEDNRYDLLEVALLEVGAQRA